MAVTREINHAMIMLCFRLLPYVKGNVGFVFTNADLKVVRDKLLENKVGFCLSVCLVMVALVCFVRLLPLQKLVLLLQLMCLCRKGTRSWALRRHPSSRRCLLLPRSLEGPLKSWYCVLFQQDACLQ